MQSMSELPTSTENAITLPNVMDIAACNTVQAKFHDLLNASPGMIMVDAGKVERISTAGIQTLFSAFKSGERQKIAIRLVNVNEAIAMSIEDLGLGNVLASWIKGE